MANRYPLILDTTDANKIKELQTGDNLNLADNSIVGVQNITALGTIDAAVLKVNGNRIVAQSFIELTDTPSYYTGHADKFVAVNSAGTAVEFRPLSDFGNINVASYRRWMDIKKSVPLKEVKNSLKKRTKIDKSRKYSPLIRVKDSKDKLALAFKKANLDTNLNYYKAANNEREMSHYIYKTVHLGEKL